MTRRVDSGETEQRRLLRRGRLVARLLLVWVLVVLALHLLDLALEDFAMPHWWQPVVFAALYGLLTAVVWPLALRVALPLAVFTLGLGSFVLLGGALLALSFVVPGVLVANLRTAVVVVLVVSAVGAVVSSVLALDEDELFFRRAARRMRRGEGVGEEVPPGVLLLQIDGLGFDTVRRGIRDGDLPTLARWLAEGSHALTDWHCDWSSQTGASVCALLHGSNEDILGFRWYEKDRDHVMACAHPADAAEIERRHSNGRGLLAGGGAARGGLFSGDADHTSLTMSRVPFLAHHKRTDGVGSGYYAYFANPANLLRTAGSALVDVLREISASTRQRRAGVQPRVKRGGFYPFARAGTTVIARDLVVSAIIGDMLAGRPVVYADFLGYDEVAHHTGIERFDALAVIRAIDQQIGRLHRAARLAPRPYRLVVLSDHGVTQGQAFTDRFGESVEALVGRLCGAEPGPRRRTRHNPKPIGGWQLNAAMAAAAGAGPIARTLRARADRAHARPERHRAPGGEPGAVARAAPGVVVVVSGHVAMVSFTEHAGRVELETIEQEFPELLPALADHPGVGFVLVRSAKSGPMVLGRDGARRLADDSVTGADPLEGYGELAADLIRRTDGFPHCPDLLINSRYTPASDDASPFEPHVGSHGGLGGGQSRGFLLYPAELPGPGKIVGAEELHRVVRGWLTHLGHPEPAEPDIAYST
ncbi:MAG TPA: phage holin family protein [Actinophytocola sp.]|uniref:phage holin family protein n=1 Tax=Actinophytocola sp. TaxID=1872138 RepID=UPI002F944BBB